MSFSLLPHLIYDPLPATPRAIIFGSINFPKSIFLSHSLSSIYFMLLCVVLNAISILEYITSYILVCVWKTFKQTITIIFHCDCLKEIIFNCISFQTRRGKEKQKRLRNDGKWRWLINGKRSRKLSNRSQSTVNLIV